MSIERIFHCDGPDCERHVRTMRDHPPMFLTVIAHEDANHHSHFCGWDCVLRHAATIEPEQVIAGGPDG